MVDNASGSGRETGRSQRPKSRVDYTSQIYINVPSKAVTAPVTSSKPKLRNSKGSNRQSTHSTKKQKLKNSPPANCHVLRGSQGSAGKSKPLRGNVLCDQSNVTATDSRLGPSIEAKASKLVHDSSGEGKRRRADGRLHEAKPATPTPELELPKRKKRRNTGNDPKSSPQAFKIGFCLKNGTIPGFIRTHHRFVLPHRLCNARRTRRQYPCRPISIK